MYDLTRDHLSTWDAYEVGYTFSVCLMDSGQLQQCCYGVLLRDEFLFSCLSGPVGVGLNELKRKLLISDTQHYGVTVPRKFCTVYAAHADPALTRMRAAGWLPAFTDSLHPSPGEGRVTLSTYYREGN